MRLVNRRKVAAAAILGMAACAVAACDSSSPQAPSSSAAGGTAPAAAGASSAAGDAAINSKAAVAACSGAPSGLVGKTLGIPTGKLIANLEGPVTVCAYAGRYEVLVRYQTGEDAAQFAQARSSQAGLHQAVSDVPGLGDGAYFARYTASNPPSNTLAARKGDRAVFITSPAALGRERSLMAALLTKD